MEVWASSSILGDMPLEGTLMLVTSFASAAKLQDDEVLGFGLHGFLLSGHRTSNLVEWRKY